MSTDKKESLRFLYGCVQVENVFRHSAKFLALSRNESDEINFFIVIVEVHRNGFAHLKSG